MAYTLLDKLKEIMQGALPQPQNTGVGPTLANQQPIAQPQPQPIAQQMPAQPQGQLPALPNMGQPSGGGGLANALAGMGKSFLGTAAETVPVALANYALFGGGEMGQRMTYASMVNQLDEKRKKAEERKTNKRAALGNFNYAIQEYGSKKYKVDPEVTMTAIYGDGTTGIPEFDAELKPHIDSIGTLIKQGDLDATDVDVSRIKSFEYRKAVLGDTMSLEKFEQQKELKLLGKEPRNIDPLSTEGIKAKQELIAYKEEHKTFAPKEPQEKKEYFDKEGKSHFLPKNAEVPSGYTRVTPAREPKKYNMTWMYNNEDWTISKDQYDKILKEQKKQLDLIASKSGYTEQQKINEQMKLITNVAPRYGGKKKVQQTGAQKQLTNAQYKTAEEVKTAFSKGTIQKDEALKILREQFGME